MCPSNYKGQRRDPYVICSTSGLQLESLSPSMSSKCQESGIDLGIGDVAGKIKEKGNFSDDGSKFCTILKYCNLKLF